MNTIGALETQVRKLAHQYPNAVYQPLSQIIRACSYEAGSVANGPNCEGCIVGQAGRIVGGEVWQTMQERPVVGVVELLLGCAWLDVVQQAQAAGGRGSFSSSPTRGRALLPSCGFKPARGRQSVALPSCSLASSSPTLRSKGEESKEVATESPSFWGLNPLALGDLIP